MQNSSQQFKFISQNIISKDQTDIMCLSTDPKFTNRPKRPWFESLCFVVNPILGGGGGGGGNLGVILVRMCEPFF